MTISRWLRTRMSKSRATKRFLGSHRAIALLVALLLLVLVAILGEVLAPRDPNVQDLAARNAGPSRDYLLGADLLGRDVLSRLVSATRVSLVAAAIGLGVAVALGVPVGILAGYRRGMIDAITGRAADALLSLPPLILAIAIVGALGPGLTEAMIAVGVVFAPRFYRIARGQAITISHQPFIEAARADGCSTWRIVFRHLLPSASGPLLVQTSFTLGYIISAEASLSFLGLGVQRPQASWGSMLREAFGQIYRNSFQIIPPSLLIAFAIFVFAALGDALRDSIGRDAEAGG